MSLLFILPYRKPVPPIDAENAIPILTAVVKDLKIPSLLAISFSFAPSAHMRSYENCQQVANIASHDNDTCDSYM